MIKGRVKLTRSIGVTHIKHYPQSHPSNTMCLALTLITWSPLYWPFLFIYIVEMLENVTRLAYQGYRHENQGSKRAVSSWVTDLKGQ